MKTDNYVQPLTYDEDGWICTYIEIIESTEYLIGFTVYRVTAWDWMSQIPVESCQYIAGRIKWDGTLRFSPVGSELCLSNREEIKQLNGALLAVYDLASETMEYFEGGAQ